MGNFCFVGFTFRDLSKTPEWKAAMLIRVVTAFKGKIRQLSGFSVPCVCLDFFAFFLGIPINMFDVDSLIAIHRLQLWGSTDGPWKSKMEENRGTVFSRDVTAAMLVSLNKGTAAMLVSQTNPSGIELSSLYENVFFCFGWKTCSLITSVKTLYRHLRLSKLFADSNNSITGGILRARIKSRTRLLRRGWEGDDVKCLSRARCSRSWLTSR